MTNRLLYLDAITKNYTVLHSKCKHSRRRKRVNICLRIINQRHNGLGNDGPAKNGPSKRAGWPGATGRQALDSGAEPTIKQPVSQSGSAHSWNCPCINPRLRATGCGTAGRLYSAHTQLQRGRSPMDRQYCVPDICSSGSRHGKGRKEHGSAQIQVAPLSNCLITDKGQR